MTDARTRASWKAAALSGEYTRIENTMQGMLASGWPQLAGYMFVYESQKPKGPAQVAELRKALPKYSEATLKAMAKRDQKKPVWREEYYRTQMQEAFVSRVEKLYDRKFKGTSGESDHSRQKLREQAQIFARIMFLGGEDSKSTTGHQLTRNFAFASSDGSAEAQSFNVSIVGIGVAHCASCAGTRSEQANTLSCKLFQPEDVFKERMKYFGTAMHEFAHSVRGLTGVLKYSTADERRKEENIAEVFQHLMLVQVFGEPGLMMLRERTPERYYGPHYYYYEATGPLLAADAFVTRNPEALLKMSPRQILGLAEQLVTSNDPTLKMTEQERETYMAFLSQGRYSAEADAMPGVSRAVATLMSTFADHSQRRGIYKDIDDLRDVGNPFLTQEMKDYSVMGSDKALEDFRKFVKDLNPDFCPPIEIVEVELMPGLPGYTRKELIQPPAPGSKAPAKKAEGPK
jgi:hypothetical protein